MRQKALKKVKQGDDVLAEDWNRLVDIITQNSLDVGSSAGLNMRQTMGGTGLALSQTIRGGSVAITTSTITARVGTTPGSGTVNEVAYDELADELVTDTSQDIDVLNFSSTTGGIPDSTYVWIEQDDAGYWWITAVDCGN